MGVHREGMLNGRSLTIVTNHSTTQKIAFNYKTLITSKTEL